MTLLAPTAVPPPLPAPVGFSRSWTPPQAGFSPIDPDQLRKIIVMARSTGGSGLLVAAPSQQPRQITGYPPSEQKPQIYKNTDPSMVDLNGQMVSYHAAKRLLGELQSSSYGLLSPDASVRQDALNKIPILQKALKQHPLSHPTAEEYVASKTPELKEGFVRIYRGEPKGIKRDIQERGDAGKYFTTNEKATGIYGEEKFYVDLPEKRYKELVAEDAENRRILGQGIYHESLNQVYLTPEEAKLAKPMPTKSQLTAEWEAAHRKIVAPSKKGK